MAHQDPGCCCFLDQTKLASGRHCLAHLFSKCFCTSQLHPPGCPAEPSRASCLCPAPPEGISSCRQGEGWWLPFLFWLLPAEVHLLFLGILGGKLNGDSPVVAGGGVRLPWGALPWAYQAIILAPGSAWVTKCQQVPGHTARNWLCWDTLLSVLPPL